ncbi:hypothetical protein [Tropicibacter naphthalenivorans]|uniref:Integral membrane protein n=1 Tax=Tropicibacter naphthalenivorans TaxID=441103 RepID=A0A0P1GEZ4_9RHOB|nr:hypothetical protein [Tropicibacter naphthalenivorans]CUH80036.1 hypothetical protein TRN7648_02754 [Tropicibacter naphthalenivorans]SMC83642.1 hypothetical protein SAMN04488093_10523 [Tropicibacter naphthalenivorans]
MIRFAMASAALTLGTFAASGAVAHDGPEPHVIGPYTYSQYTPIKVTCPKNTTVASDRGVLYCVPNTAWAPVVCD